MDNWGDDHILESKGNPTAINHLLNILGLSHSNSQNMTPLKCPLHHRKLIVLKICLFVKPCKWWWWSTTLAALKQRKSQAYKSTSFPVVKKFMWEVTPIATSEQDCKDNRSFKEAQNVFFFLFINPVWSVFLLWLGRQFYFEFHPLVKEN